MIFDELAIDEEFKAKGRKWVKKSQFAAKCLSKSSPFDPEALIAFDRKEKVELADNPKAAANSIFRRRK